MTHSAIEKMLYVKFKLLNDELKNVSDKKAYIQIQADLEGITIDQYLENKYIEHLKSEHFFKIFSPKEYISLTRWRKFCNIFSGQGWISDGKNKHYIGWGWETGKCKNCGATYPCTIIGSSNSAFCSGPLIQCDKCGSYRNQTYFHGTDH